MGLAAPQAWASQHPCITHVPLNLSTPHLRLYNGKNSCWDTGRDMKRCDNGCPHACPLERVPPDEGPLTPDEDPRPTRPFQDRTPSDLTKHAIKCQLPTRLVRLYPPSQPLSSCTGVPLTIRRSPPVCRARQAAPSPEPGADHHSGSSVRMQKDGRQRAGAVLAPRQRPLTVAAPHAY